MASRRRLRESNHYLWNLFKTSHQAALGKYFTHFFLPLITSLPQFVPRYSIQPSYGAAKDMSFGGAFIIYQTHGCFLGAVPLDDIANRKYKDYVYRKMLVQEYLKKWRIFKRVKPTNDMMFHDIYNCICQNTKKIRFIIHYVKPTAQLLFRIRFPKGGPTCRRQVVNPRHQTSQGQSVAKPETPLQNIQVE